MGAFESLQESFINLGRTIKQFFDRDPFFGKKLAKKERAAARARRRSQRNNQTIKVTPHGRQYRVRRARK